MRYNRSILEAALMGLAVRFQEIEARISAIQEQLGTKTAKSKMAGVVGIPSATRRRRPLSPAAKKRIAAAQKKRWAKFHAEQAKPKLTRKRRISPARRAALVASLAKARAARAAKRAAA